MATKKVPYESGGGTFNSEEHNDHPAVDRPDFGVNTSSEDLMSSRMRSLSPMKKRIAIRLYNLDDSEDTELVDIINSLNDRDRKLLSLVYGMYGNNPVPTREAARIVGITHNTASNKLRVMLSNIEHKLGLDDENNLPTKLLNPNFDLNTVEEKYRPTAIKMRKLAEETGYCPERIQVRDHYKEEYRTIMEGFISFRMAMHKFGIEIKYTKSGYDPFVSDL